MCVWFASLSIWSNKSIERGYLLQKPKKFRLYWFYLTNSSPAFQNTSSVFTGNSDFHKLVLTVFKMTIVKSKPKGLSHRDYKHFNHKCFERLEVFKKHFWKNRLSRIWKNVHLNSHQACTYEKDGKSGSLHDERFAQSNYEKIPNRN